MLTDKDPVDAVHSPSKINGPTLMGVAWAGCAIAFLFVCFRTYSRIRSLRRLLLDDVFMFTAMATYIATCATYQQQYYPLYELAEVYAMEREPGPDYFDRMSRLLRAMLANLLLHYACLWAVKGSILALFWQLLGGDARTRGRKLWSVVAAATVVGLIVCFADMPYKCFGWWGNLWDMAKCQETAERKRQLMIVSINCALDVVTDAMILSIPFFLFWRSFLPPRHQLSLLALFSLRVIIAVFAIIRIVYAKGDQASRVTQLTWLFFWGNVEMACAIIVGCLIAFRKFFVRQHAQPSHRYYKQPNGGIDSPKAVLLRSRNRPSFDDDFDPYTPSFGGGATTKITPVVETTNKNPPTVSQRLREWCRPRDVVVVSPLYSVLVETEIRQEVCYIHD